MGFMEQQIELGNWYACETKHGETEIVPVDLVGKTPEVADFALYCEGEVESFELLENKYGARMSAPGFMDRTDWSVFDTEEEAQKYLDETYGDD